VASRISTRCACRSAATGVRRDHGRPSSRIPDGSGGSIVASAAQQSSRRPPGPGSEAR
jgi:hypothetical protein